MFKQTALSSTPRLHSTSGTFGEITIVGTSDGVLIDASNFDTAGHLHREHAMADLSLSAAARLRDLLTEAIDNANSCELDTRQTRLWSNATLRATARRLA